MGSIPPQSPTKLRPRSRDTGFPENFCGIGNTSLPHPEANLSPDACITADDISVSRALNRQRRSFLAKHKRTISHGVISPDHERAHGDAALLSESDGPAHRHQSRSSKDADSLALSDGSYDPDSSDSPKLNAGRFARLPKPEAAPERRRSFLQRWMHHK